MVGLGNPGPRYAMTRHNFGHLALDALAERMGPRMRTHKSRRADVAEGRLQVGGPRVVLGRPRCYMNESGGPVKSLLDFYKIPTERLVVLHDEIDLPFGGLRVKYAGGDNGHNGLRSIRSALGSGDFYRVRLGVGRPDTDQSAADYVLSNFTAGEGREVGFEIGRAVSAVESLILEGLQVAQARHNS